MKKINSDNKILLYTFKKKHIYIYIYISIFK